MSLINFKTILSCSSEDRVHCAENLLKIEQYKKWLSSKPTEERLTCTLELEKSSFISSLDIGNDGCAFIELFVSRSSSSKSDDWTVLLPATVFMTPNESRSNTNRTKTKSFKSSELNKICLNEKWDRLKIVCDQKFNRVNQFGLSFIKLYSPNDEDNQSEDDETAQEQSKIGSFFAKKKLKTSETTPNNQTKSLLNVAEEVLSRKSMNNNEIETESPKQRTRIMKDIIFVLSGFQNPLRSQLRNKATSMGAVYNDDWDDKCTHLICAFPNTPKFTQVQQTGKGFIVNKQWILDCYEQNQLLSEKSYEFNDNGTPKRTSEKQKTKIQEEPILNRKTPVKMKSITVDVEEPVVQKKTPVKKKSITVDVEEPVVQKKTPVKKKSITVDAEEPVVQKKTPVKKESITVDAEEPVVQKKTPVKKKSITIDAEEPVVKKKTPVKKKSITVNDDETKDKKKIGELPDFFHKKHFYVSYGDYDDSTLLDITRVILAYDGILERQVTTDVQYVITNRMWNQDFEKISKTNPEINFLNLDWLQDCHNENQFVAMQSYLIVP